MPVASLSHPAPEFALIEALRLAECYLLKPSAFEYRAPQTLDEAVALLTAHPGSKLIAGGQSLMPILAFRLAAPSLLVDLRRLPGLGEIVIDADGVRLGAKESHGLASGERVAFGSIQTVFLDAQAVWRLLHAR